MARGTGKGGGWVKKEKKLFNRYRCGCRCVCVCDRFIFCMVRWRWFISINFCFISLPEVPSITSWLPVPNSPDTMSSFSEENTITIPTTDSLNPELKESWFFEIFQNFPYPKLNIHIHNPISTIGLFVPLPGKKLN